MASSGIDDCDTHIFDGTNFARWENHMLDHFRAKGPKFWWIVTNGLTHILDHKNLTKALKVLFELDYEAYDYLIESWSFELFDRINSKGTAYEMWESIKHTFGDSSTWDDGKFKKEEPKVEIHEVVEHDHNMVVVEVCSTTWSSDGDNDATTRSHDKDDDDATSDANDDATSCTLDDEDDGYESDASTSSSTTSPHCFMSHGDTKVSIGDVIIDCDGPNFELVCKLSKALRNELAKTSKLRNQNSFLKTTSEQQKHLLYVTTCSHEELKLVHEEHCVAHDNLSSSLGSNDQSHSITNPCDVGKKHVSTSCDDLLSMPCSSHLDAFSTSMSCETNLLNVNNELKNEVKNFSNKLERCYYSKVTFEHILKTQRNYGDKCGLGFKEKMTKGKRKQEKRKLSHFMCYRCHEVEHLANGCPNKEKLKKMKEEERLKHVKCFKCRTWGHLTSMCPTKKLVRQQEKPQPKPQFEQEKKPQAQVKFNHHGDLMMKKKKTRRGRRARHPRKIQDAKMISKDDGHFASRCPTKLEKKAQATLKRQGNENQHMSMEEKAQSKRSCYLCRKKGHMALSCPLGNSSKPISIDDNTMLRKDGNGTSMVAIAKYPATHTKAMPKYVAPNLRGPKLVWVPSKSG
ncbi:hypothetical protein BDA96_03G189900 [Sorghum bicolor]|uniref:CCHC-type domain-containing protein n=2 Tax=Sorghum bicolor TaxID=4558 RepID=A0A921RE43_SORBI|nr:hypothetical protein BDA96_03G189900 [Sorghum bicolor]OQU86942.1 hypothetical protein SORBI_3003G175633 [Sorghum bicolor]